jgi:hypothetical protein
MGYPRVWKYRILPNLISPSNAFRTWDAHHSYTLTPPEHAQQVRLSFVARLLYKVGISVVQKSPEKSIMIVLDGEATRIDREEQWRRLL